LSKEIKSLGRIKRPERNNYDHNFLTPDSQNIMRNLTMPSPNMMGNSSMTPYYQEQQLEISGLQGEFMVQQQIHRTQSNFELHSNENNVHNMNTDGKKMAFVFGKG